MERNNDIKNFFESIAPHWDDMECVPPARIQALLSKVRIEKGERVLDVACGTGIITKKLATLSETKVLGIDLSPKMIEIAKNKNSGETCIEFQVADFTETDFKEAYDVVVIYNAFPHFLEVARLEEALWKALRQGGRFAILHSLSRKELALHHANVPDTVSRRLMSPEEESKAFLDRFEILEASESDSHYCIVGKKK